MRFAELFESAASRSEVVCTFLALLELIRLKQLVCVQPEAVCGNRNPPRDARRRRAPKPRRRPKHPSSAAALAEGGPGTVPASFNMETSSLAEMPAEPDAAPVEPPLTEVPPSAPVPPAPDNPEARQS